MPTYGDSSSDGVCLGEMVFVEMVLVEMVFLEMVFAEMDMMEMEIVQAAAWNMWGWALTLKSKHFPM